MTLGQHLTYSMVNEFKQDTRRLDMKPLYTSPTRISLAILLFAALLALFASQAFTFAPHPASAAVEPLAPLQHPVIVHALPSFLPIPAPQPVPTPPADH